MEDDEYKVISFKNLRIFWIILFFVLASLAPILSSFSQLTSVIRNVLAELIVSAPGNSGRNLYTGHYTIHDAAAIALIVIMLALVYLLVVVVSFGISLRHERARAVKRETSSISTLKLELATRDADLSTKNLTLSKLRTQIDRSMTDMKKVHYQLLAGYNPRIQNFRAVNASYFVKPGGHIDVEEEYELVAADQPVPFWRYIIDGDDKTSVVESFGDLTFSAVPLDDGTNTAVFPFDDRARHKSILIWFLPQIEAGKSRRFKIRYDWPGFLAGLDHDRVTNFKWTYQPHDNSSLTNFKATFTFSEVYSPVDCRVTATSHPKLQLSRVIDKERTCWIFAGVDIPLANAVYELTFYREQGSTN